MCKPVKMVLHFFAIVAIVVATTMMFAPSSQSNSPYLSALSDLAATPALAKGKCTNRACEFVAPGHACLESARTNCLAGCVTVSC
jgi:hypothetical protein